MTLSDLNQEIYIVITNEADKENASKLANLLLKEKLIPCITFKNINSVDSYEKLIKKLKSISME